MLRRRIPIIAFVLSLFIAVSAYAAITGVISGTVTDPSGAVVPNATVTALNQQTGVKSTTVTDGKGFYSFPALDVGIYTVSTEMSGFETFKTTDITVDANSSVRTDVILKIGTKANIVTVQANALQVDTQSTQLGEVIESTQITAVPLNGRAFTDLLALQPGVSPYSDKAEGNATNNDIGGLNPGNVSINGSREASNGFMVNGLDVNDGVENGTAIMINLDSIAEFRIITSSFDAEYGNFNGGQVNVVTKNGGNSFHGSAFEFLRNTDFNAANYFNHGVRSPYTQNIYGGTFSGPIMKDKLFFFADYQATQANQGTTDQAVVPSSADLTGNLADLSGLMTGTVIGTGWANVLQNRLGYAVSAGEPYYTNGCTLSSQCVFPNAVVPTSAWDPVPSHLFKYIPSQSGTYTVNGYPGYLNTSSATTTTDRKEAGRVDAQSRIGKLFGYYFLDNITVANPFAGGTAGGFPASTTTRGQLYNLGVTTTVNSNTVNAFRFGYMRMATHSNQPQYTTPGPSLSSLGFVSPWSSTTGGIGNIYAGLAGVPQISINSLSFGTPTETQGHYDNTFQWIDNWTHFVGLHTFQAGGNYHYDQIMERNYYDVNGGFSFADGNETGSGFADFLLGAENGSFTQASLQLLDSRSHYAGAYLEDSWRIRPDLTLNYGVRYEISTPWYDTQNKLETIVPGQQSKVFPGAPTGWVVPGDTGIPRTLAHVKYNKFAPRFGFAYAPRPTGTFLDKVTGSNFSIRGSWGLFYSNFQDESGFVEVGDAPYGLYWSTPVPVMLSAPYIQRATQTVEPAKFPYVWPPTNVSASNPDNNIPWAALEPLSSSDAVGVNNTVPYTENYFLGLQRGIGRNTVVTLNYSGSEGHHLANSMEANPGNIALCESLTTTALVAGSTACGPKLESQLYQLVGGQYIYGTRILNPSPSTEGLAFGSNPYLLTQANSNYNALQANFKHSSTWGEFLVAYTFGRSFDNASAMTDSVYYYNPKTDYALSKYDSHQYLVASYNLHIPADQWVSNRAAKQIVGGWSITGVTKEAAGTPVTMAESDDRSLTGGSGGDLPNYTPGSIVGDHNPRDGKPWFNTALFSKETIGVYGDSHRRFFAGPGLNHTDIALVRDFHIYKTNVVTFRAEAFNIANHVEFSNPGATVNSTSSFGKISSAVASQRILQLAFKYKF